MLRRTLIDFHADLSALESEFVVYDDGYRSWSYSYAQVSRAAAEFAARSTGKETVETLAEKVTPYI